jgi:hypothetical protein
MKQLLALLFLLSAGMAVAQSSSEKAPDSVIIKVGKSRIILAIRDTADIRVLQEYDLEALVKDAVGRVTVSKDSADKEEEREISIYLFNKKFATMRKGDLTSIDSKDLEKIQQQAEESVQQAQQLAEQELKWLRDQEKFIESESNLDREEIKRIIKDRAELLKEKAKELSEHKTEFSGGFEFDFDADSDDEDSDPDPDQKKTYQSTHFDLGTLNYLTDGKFPDGDNAPYTLSPQGSIYFAVTNIFRTRLANKMFLEWGLGFGGHYFRYQNDNIQMLKSGTGIEFIPDTRDLDYRKSKFVNHFVQASFIPVIDFGGNKIKPGLFDGVESPSFRFGFGPYLGYRTGSYTKRVYKEDGERERLRNRDNFYLNNLRYGLRLQLGYREIDLFFTYDLNNLFVTGRAPELNVFSFGVSL